MPKTTGKLGANVQSFSDPLPAITVVKDRPLPTKIDPGQIESAKKGGAYPGLNKQTLGEDLSDFNMLNGDDAEGGN